MACGAGRGELRLSDERTATSTGSVKRILYSDDGDDDDEDDDDDGYEYRERVVRTGT